jgi:hypothetical protein
MIESLKIYYVTPDQIIFDKQVFSYCKLRYPDHPQGCPNVGKCLHPPDAAKKIQTAQQIRLYVVKFNLEKHVVKMKETNPVFTDKQARCVLYWQNTVKKAIRMTIEQIYSPGDYVLGCGSGFKIGGQLCQSMEAAGIHVFKTLTNLQIDFEEKPVKNVTMVSLIARYPQTLKPTFLKNIQHKLF